MDRKMLFPDRRYLIFHNALQIKPRFVDQNGRIPGIKKILAVDSLAAVTGELFGASSVTTYIEMEWESFGEAFPAFLTIIGIPLI